MHDLTNTEINRKALNDSEQVGKIPANNMMSSYLRALGKTGSLLELRIATDTHAANLPERETSYKRWWEQVATVAQTEESKGLNEEQEQQAIKQIAYYAGRLYMACVGR